MTPTYVILTKYMYQSNHNHVVMKSNSDEKAEIPTSDNLE